MVVLREDGQAAVEMVALLPWVAAVLLVAWQFVVAGDARLVGGDRGSGRCSGGGGRG